MDWQKIIRDLIEHGLTQNEISAAADISQSHISAILNGKRLQPSWAIGERLIRLHRKVTKRKPPVAKETAAASYTPLAS
ncbi:helix-turn-helix transcriptional regulator [Microvirgula aerodenitrificans]|uniref:helix-turn-helix transcriptional regulator n=1 Tax=Microvirgula aerodenitrificans TaxID=57480 RepID=UPI0028F04AEA|nr:helix-turn-helix transcriptional regulator [Microvirgula aerodenitrificans]